MESPFDVLQIDPDADEREIERAYKRRVKEAHPDHGGSAAEFRTVRAAYQELTSGRPRGNRDSDREEGRTERRSGDVRRRRRSDEGGEQRSGESGERRRSEAGEERQRNDENREQRPETSQVEYLDYAVLDDHGWSLDDDDLFEKASGEGLEPPEYGRITVDTDDPLLEGAEDSGFTWPYSCRGGACANCAVAVLEGELSMPASHILPTEMLDRGIRLSCIGTPTLGETKVVYNVKHLPDLDELRLPPGPFEHARR